VHELSLRQPSASGANALGSVSATANAQLIHYVIVHRVAILEALALLSSPRNAGVAKLVYAPDSKSGEVKLMSVRVRPPAPNSSDFPHESTFVIAESEPNLAKSPLRY
jgi:uncharacterized protein YgbK (DUF1537 family)